MVSVPVSEALHRLSEDPRFWSFLFVNDGAYPDTDPAEVRVSLPVTGGYGLVLDIDLVTGEQTLGLRVPSSNDPVQLCSAEPGRPAPAALRWHELELCARVIALEDPTLPHPGLVVALLSPFAPATPDDDGDAVAAVREAAYRSLRREVHPVTSGGPEQAPLPLFASDDWWPRPPSPSPQVIDEAAIAAYTAPASVRLEVRGGSRFPREDLAELVRRAAQRLSRLPEERWYAQVRPLARRMADTGDLGPVKDLLGVLTEAGCDHPTVLDALSEPIVEAEACWMVETLAGAVPGSLRRRQP
ncbi:hypothetical protein ACFQFC_24030 [Amorphoplanes digitatis]|uniref:hypothetical protein n=1 Tax=Actinoplanes digitatis TaxID=1868 RepID=UPI00160FF1FA|nr:hypothetical protein [Actinoplanes digitatis]